MKIKIRDTNYRNIPRTLLLVVYFRLLCLLHKLKLTDNAIRNASLFKNRLRLLLVCYEAVAMCECYRMLRNVNCNSSNMLCML